ncbi:carboxylesterase/lipase family protein [Sphingosinicella sp. BN140058]|uniref:carboxylesterase/lipase family protein n=1 Tax=Sphingosinicella sp. BN140058 TaxID=1892855 RepID=UPI001011813E|nr:carboxylesterase/lipase family protein [Sphingosinicella sp. BN140058]QAY76011.1 carboxylesterase/lipase family protein [Sphingosinicella sp. BN140058]
MIDRRTMIGAGALLGAAGLLPAAAGAAAKAPVVTTRQGRLRGRLEGGLAVFRGIRYGRAERFKAPTAVPPSRDIVDALAFGPSAPQRGTRYAPASEDCLFLNVWTPEAKAGGKRPVLVYIHGGAYSSGSVVDPLNDGRHLAARGDAVVVTVNHRLNALGYLYLARLDPNYPDSGNLGQLDLILALIWIRDNIAAFGGDPGRVLVFGQSGGGAKIATMMGMPAARGLFHRAITMSGQQVTASGPLNATARARAYLDALKATPADLAAMPLERLIEGLGATDPILGGGVYFGPVLDMKWLTRHPFWPDANPQSNGVPMMLGNTRDETRAFIDPKGPKLAGLDWSNLAERMTPELRMDLPPEWIVAQYRARFPDWSPERVFYAATTAGRSWPGQVIEADVRAAADTPTWVYQVDYQSPVEPWRGAPHTIDIPLSFGTLDAEGSITGTGADARAVSERMMDAFLAFARSGDPKHPGLEQWPRYRLPARSTMVFDIATRAIDDPRKWERELFARVPYIQPGT